jgi:ornithine carbamoyltransferase
MRHLLTLADVSAAEVEQLCIHAHLLKQKRATSPIQHTTLAGKTIVLLFEKPSLRTRVSFEVAAYELGANCLYLSPQEVGLGKRESAADVARVLSSYVHCVVLRTFDHALLEAFAQHATIPVINGLTDAHHPCQGLTDVFTIVEHCGMGPHVTVTYLGDGNNCAHSLMQGAVRLGYQVRIASPPGYEPDPALVAQAQAIARQTGGSVQVMHDPQQAVIGADVLYTDVWASMGQEEQSEERSAIFAPYQINDHLLAYAKPDAIVLHPLPAHRNQEITDAVLDGPHSRAFAQAENRLHMQKAVLHHLVAVRQPVAVAVGV